MTRNHLIDRDIQRYALEPNVCSKGIIDHIQQCEDCKQKAMLYRIVWKGIHQQEKPVFDFNLSDLVMPQLQPVKSPVLYHKPFVYCLITISILLTGTTFYRIGSDLFNRLSAFTPILFYLLLTTAGGLFLFLFSTMYVEFRRKMEALKLNGLQQ